MHMLEERGRRRTLCPSEAARRVADERGASHEWRSLMEPARSAGRRLAARGQLVFRQGGQRVDPSRARGPVRLGRP